ncbi:MAG: efflux RND transporter periplasmic adaptor subunit [Beijerinckiaceae bacterium]|nr:efflux RND transporter periplasmic adaptor subunit [Beijerinckiaceae bacterium]
MRMLEPAAQRLSQKAEPKIDRVDAVSGARASRLRWLSWGRRLLVILVVGGPVLWFAFPAWRPAIPQAIADIAARPAAKGDEKTLVRGVRVVTVALSDTVEQRRLTGVVAPRWETQLGFRVGGKISERHVETAQQVRAGDVLFRLDDEDYLAAVRVAEADLTALRAQARQAAAEEIRQQNLLAKGFTARAAFDRAAANASASAEQAKASEQKLLLARNQFAYVALRAPHDGVVTAIRAEAGQVVPQGQPVLTLARSDEREALVAIPEGKVQDIMSWSATTALGSVDGDQAALTLREVAAQADPASRTFAARYTLPLSATTLPALGSTITINLTRRAAHVGAVLPSSAIMVEKSEASVWIIGASGDRAERRAVRIVDLGAEVTRVTGLEDGMHVVTLGVHRLDSGMRIRVIGNAREAAANR